MSYIYIDVTGTMEARFTTGIQRTVKQFTQRMTEQKGNVILLQKIPNTSEYGIVTLKQFENPDRENGEVYERKISLNEIGNRDIFLDLDSVWNLFEDRRQMIYPKLKSQGVTIVTQVYDILPIQYPQFFEENTAWHFLLYLSSVLTYSDVILVNSNATKKAIEALAADRRIPYKTIKVVPLGADFQERSVKEEDISEGICKAIRKPYILMLGTLEPRKNHKILLDAFDEGLSRLPVNIIIAGRKGWNIDHVIQRIKNHSQYGNRIFFYENPTDVEVSALYHHAYGLVIASFGEGFGLPLIEALHYQKLVFASNIEVFREIGQDCCLYFNPNNPETLIQRVAETIADPQVAEQKLDKIKNFHITSWNEASNKLMSLIDEISSEPIRTEKLPADTFQTPTQLFVISARVDDLLETLPFYGHFMPYIRQVVIGCPERIVEPIREKYKGSLQLLFLTDEELLNGREMPEDHQTRNTLFRSLAMEREELADVFIMADDDNRPLCTIPKEYFVNNNRFNIYYCCEDIREWQPYIGGFTSYDHGMKRTAMFLSDHGLTLKQYSSHQPQKKKKKVFLEAVHRFPEVLNSAIDEWSLYGNYAMTFYSDSFTSNLFNTMCWPASATDWVVKTPPKIYLFENFYRELYRKGGLFEFFSTVYHDAILDENLKKVQLRMAEQDQYETGREVSKACDRLYFLTYHDDPGWEINADEMQIKLPKILMGKSGYFKKERFRIINHGEITKQLQIRGQFIEKETGRTYAFLKEDLNLSTMNGDYEIPMRFPTWEFIGVLQLHFALDGQESVSWEIPVMTF